MVMSFEFVFAKRRKSNYAANQLESYETTKFIFALVGAWDEKAAEIKSSFSFILTP
jgi:hypothetical protein